MELYRKKNAATTIPFPAVSSVTPANFITGVSPVDTAYYNDGAGWVALAISATAAEIGSTGQFSIAMTAAEMNHDLIVIKFSVATMADTSVIIRTGDNYVDDVRTIVDAIKAVTDLLPDAGALSDLAAIRVVTDVLPNSGALNDLGALAARLTAARAGYLDELAAANIPADVDAIKAKTDNLPETIQKNIDWSTDYGFEMLDSNGALLAGETVTAQVSIDGGAYAAMANAVTEVGGGTYKIRPAAADVNGHAITWKFTSADADPTLVKFITTV